MMTMQRLPHCWTPLRRGDKLRFLGFGWFGSLFSDCIPDVFPAGTVAEGAPIIPISAQLKYNIEVVCEYIVKKIPVPIRDFTSEPRLIGNLQIFLPVNVDLGSLWLISALGKHEHVFSYQIFWCEQTWMWSRWLERRRGGRKYPEGCPQGQIQLCFGSAPRGTILIFALWFFWVFATLNHLASASSGGPRDWGAARYRLQGPGRKADVQTHFLQDCFVVCGTQWPAVRCTRRPYRWVRGQFMSWLTLVSEWKSNDLCRCGH